MWLRSALSGYRLVGVLLGSCVVALLGQSPASADTSAHTAYSLGLEPYSQAVSSVAMSPAQSYFTAAYYGSAGTEADPVVVALSGATLAPLLLVGALLVFLLAALLVSTWGWA